ncbi:hypothetical protein HOG17_03305 [Candidatus Peregrinibacteria bacterium]|jgi:hypothetical protein|nr:hypothetical protein [Candidatus Peregrinibacteria bacterium]MBT4148233.1 hypothetical protein [Candidatus Peregrinibacteria bacterium]MBT4455871.1 hypothetical protein [Candidatus Peregrinibacteria bacterium]
MSPKSKKERPGIKPNVKTEKKSFLQSVTGISDRFKGAWDKAIKAPKGTKLRNRVFMFINQLFSEHTGIRVEEEKVEKEAKADVESFLKDADQEEIAKAVKEDLVGNTKLDKPQEESVDMFVGLGVSTFKDELNDNEESNVGTVLTLLTQEGKVPKSVDLDQKLMVAGFGFKLLKNLNLHCSKHGMDAAALAKHFDNLEAVTKKGDISNALNVDKLKSLFTIDLGSGGMLGGLKTGMKLNSILNNLNVDRTKLIGSVNKLSSPNLGGAALDGVVGTFDKILTSTSRDNVQKAVIIMNKAISTERKPTNEELAQLILLINPSDFENLSKVLT